MASLNEDTLGSIRLTLLAMAAIIAGFGGTVGARHAIDADRKLREYEEEKKEEQR